MRLTNTTNGKHYFLTKKQLEMYKYFQEVTSKSIDPANSRGYFYFTITEYCNKYGGAAGYTHKAISALIAMGAIEYNVRGRCKSIVRGIPGFVLTEF